MIAPTSALGTAVAAVAVVWGLRQLAHAAILRGLRAPRVPHTQALTDHGIAANAVQAVRMAGPRGKQLSGWLVSPSGAHPHPVPAVLVMRWARGPACCMRRTTTTCAPWSACRPLPTPPK